MTVCESGAEDGLITVLFAAGTALDEARLLANLVVEEYQALATDLVVSLQGLRTTIDSLGGEETAGAAIGAIGESLGALMLQLREPCPGIDA